MHRQIFDAIRNNNINLIKTLISNNLIIENDTNSACALKLAVCYKNLEILKYLVERGADK